SELTTIKRAFSTGRLASNGCATAPSGLVAPLAARSEITSDNRLAYGRAAVIASWARRSRAAATSFMARGIFCVFFTHAIRVRMALSEGMVLGRRALLCRLVGDELFGELGERALHQLGQLVVRLSVGALLAQRGQHVRAPRVEEGVELALPAAQH